MLAACSNVDGDSRGFSPSFTGTEASPRVWDGGGPVPLRRGTYEIQWFTEDSDTVPSDDVTVDVPFEEFDRLKADQLKWHKQMEGYVRETLSAPDLQLDRTIELQTDPDKRPRPKTPAERDERPGRRQFRNDRRLEGFEGLTFLGKQRAWLSIGTVCEGVAPRNGLALWRARTGALGCIVAIRVQLFLGGHGTLLWLQR